MDVADSEQGIAAEALPHTSEFLSTIRELGTGPGPLVCGEITVQSDGIGTTLAVWLPA